MKDIITNLLEHRHVRTEVRHAVKLNGVHVSEILINRLAQAISAGIEKRGPFVAVYSVQSGTDHGYGGRLQPFRWVRASVLHEGGDCFSYEAKDFIRELVNDESK